MTWFQQNRFMGQFLVALGLGTIACAIFLWMAKRSFDDAKIQFDQQAIEMAALQRHNPFPTEVNLRKMKTLAEAYAAGLSGLREDMKTRVLPIVPLAPNEFQARLRQAMASVSDRARANKVKLPDNFYLGFDEFAAALPDTAAASLLGQQLAQVELLLNILIDARVDAVTSVKRISLSAAIHGVTATPPSGRKTNTPPAAAPLVERTTLDTAFIGTPGSARRVLNQISTANQQFYIIRTLHVLNEKAKGPPRDSAGVARVSAAAAGSGSTPGAPSATGNTALNFIVGTERVQTSARIEMLRFNY